MWDFINIPFPTKNINLSQKSRHLNSKYLFVRKMFVRKCPKLPFSGNQVENEALECSCTSLYLRCLEIVASVVFTKCFEHISDNIF